MKRPSQSTPRRRRAPLAWLFVLALLSPALAVAPAGAATSTETRGTQTSGTDTSGFRFWGYFHLSDGDWAFAETGPDGFDPADGDVEGWRYAAATAEDPRFPRATPTFEDICGGTEAGDGEKRVGFVIDAGRPADGEDGATPPEPRAACAVVDAAANGADALAAVAEVRADPGGLTCALDGYPADGCGDPVAQLSPEALQPDEQVQLAGLADSADPQATATDSTTDSAAATAADDDGIGATVWVALAVVVVVAALALLALRRRRAAGGD